jgi:uncharacterized protein YndB with AHSA1/START domain
LGASIVTTPTFDIETTIILAQPVDQVWETLVNQGGLKRWLDAQLFVLELDDGGLIELTICRDGTAVDVVGETSLISPSKRLMFTWIERSIQGREWDFPTVVSLEFESHVDGTRMTLLHRGLKRLPPALRESVLAQYRAYWQEKMWRSLPETLLLMQEAGA